MLIWLSLQRYACPLGLHREFHYAWLCLYAYAILPTSGAYSQDWFLHAL